MEFNWVHAIQAVGCFGVPLLGIAIAWFIAEEKTWAALLCAICMILCVGLIAGFAEV